MLKTFKLIIAYDGTNYYGWQKQVAQKTIEGELMKACVKLFGQEGVVKGSSRTDAGVHALGQVASVCVDTKLVGSKIAKALNAHLPTDIIVQSAVEVAHNFHPRFHAIEKTYVYKIYNAEIPLPQNDRFASYFYYPLDLEAMQKACPYFLGTHDFFAFSSAGGNVKTSIRTLRTCEVFEKDHLYEFRVTGNSFLYNMVRVIVGTLMDVGTGRIQAEEIPAIFESMDRERSGKKAPAKGLTLVEIKY